MARSYYVIASIPEYVKMKGGGRNITASILTCCGRRMRRPNCKRHPKLLAFHYNDQVVKTTLFLTLVA